MAVLIETSLGDLEVDLYVDDCPLECENFLKLCKCKYYNFSLFHRVITHFVAQTGDPQGTGKGGESVWGLIDGPKRRYFPKNDKNRFKHNRRGTLSFVNDGNNMHGSQFFITLGDGIDSLDGVHSVFGEVAEDSYGILDKINAAIVDDKNQPYQDIRIRHTIVLDDPFPDPKGLPIPDASPLPTREQLEAGRIGDDEKIDEFEGMDEDEVDAIMKQREAQGRAQILEMIGDLPDADVKPPENVLFVCKLNPVTRDEDLRLIFSRFGKIVSCEIIKDWKSQESLQYAFIEFETPEQAEEAYFKMDNVLIDDRRIHVDFSQSVAQTNKYALPQGWKLGEGKAGSGNRLRVKSKGQVGGRKYEKYDLVFSEDQGRSKKGSKHRERGDERSKHRDRDADPSSHRDRGSSHRDSSSRSSHRDREGSSHRDRDDDRSRHRERDSSHRRRDEDNSSHRSDRRDRR